MLAKGASMASSLRVHPLRCFPWRIIVTVPH